LIIRTTPRLEGADRPDLAQRFPAHVCSEWLGHTAAIAEAHYLMTTEAHFQAALEGPDPSTHGTTRNTTRAVRARSGFEAHRGPENQKTPCFQGVSENQVGMKHAGLNKLRRWPRRASASTPSTVRRNCGFWLGLRPATAKSDVDCRLLDGSKGVHQPRRRGLWRAVTDLKIGFRRDDRRSGTAMDDTDRGRFQYHCGCDQDHRYHFRVAISITVPSISIIFSIIEGRARMPVGHLALLANCRLPAEVSW